jgi:hypothetical protein
MSPDAISIPVLSFHLMLCEAISEQTTHDNNPHRASRSNTISISTSKIMNCYALVMAISKLAVVRHRRFVTRTTQL